MRKIYTLAAGRVLTVTADGANCFVRQVEDATVGGAVLTSAEFGPYRLDRTFWIDNGTGTSVEAQDESLVLSGAAAPASAARASLNVDPTGNENGLTFTAKAYGAAGNQISVTYTDPSANDAALSVSVSRFDIRVSLATNGGGTITSTAALVKAAIEASTAASALVGVTIYAADTGAVDDGSGVVTAMAEAHLSGGAGTAVGTALPGSLYIDTTNDVTYRNAGTRLAPVWREQGEFLSTVVAFANAVAVVTNTPKDVCSLALTAGEWDVSAVLVRNLTGVTATRYTGALGTTSATIPTGAGGSGLGTDPVVANFATFGTTITGTQSTVIPPTRVVISATTTIYLIAADLFSAGTMTACGTLRARRIK
jgi:hypothetical protein